MAWMSENVPMDCQKAVMIPIHKKGSKTQCRDYHIISLLSIPGKVYASVLKRRNRTLSLKGKFWKSREHSEKKELCRPAVHW